MVFEVPESKAKDKSNRFEFKHKGKKYDVPLLGFLPGSVVEMLAVAAEKGGIAAEAANIEAFGPVGSPVGDAVRGMDRDQFQALLAAYVDASRISPGESSASTDS